MTINRKSNNQQKTKIILFFTAVFSLFSIGAIFGYFLSYFRQLWGRPGLHVRQLTPAYLETQLPEADQALHIAANNVRSGIELRHLPDGTRKFVLNAGWRNFREPWARDFGFASFGLIELDEVQVLKDGLELFLHFQQENGRFPVKIHSTSILDRYLHSLFGRQQPIHAPLKPKYQTAHNTVSYDGNALIVIAALNYLRQYDDQAFAEAHWENLKQAVRWLENEARDDTGLLHQEEYTDWADSIVRKGHIHYTNVLYWKAVFELARDAEKYGFNEDATYFFNKAERLKQTIQEYFWREDLGFFSTSHKFDDILSSDGNLLAIAWGLGTPEQAKAIFAKMEAFGMGDPVPTKPTNKSYGRSHIAIENRLGGIGHYHISAAWLWLGSWHVIALTRTGHLEEAKIHIDRMRHVILRDGVVHEVYDIDGTYLKTLWYESEAPLTWSASLFIYAHSVYQHALDDG